MTELLGAAKSGNVRLLESLLKRGRNPNVVDAKRKTALNLICAKTKLEKVDVEIIRLLIEYGGDVNVRDENLDSPIMNLLNRKYDYELPLELLDLLLEHDADVSHVNIFGETMVHRMIESDCELDENRLDDLLKLVLEGGIDVNYVDNRGETFLHYAVYRESPAMFELLLKYGADINIPDSNGETSLFHIFAHFQESIMYDRYDFEKRLDLLRLHVRNGADLARINATGKTALHALIVDRCVANAAHDDSNFETIATPHERRDDNDPIERYVPKYIEEMLTHGLDVDVQDGDGLSPLDRAVSYCDLSIVGLLLEYGADARTVRFEGGLLDPKANTFRNLKITRSLVAILELLEGEGFVMTESDDLRICKFLTCFNVNEESFCSSCSDDSSSDRMRRAALFILSFGSGSSLERFVDMCLSIFRKEEVYRIVVQLLYTVQVGDIFVKDKIRIYLQNKRSSLILEHPEFHRIDAERDEMKTIEMELASARETVIGNETEKISLLDLCRNSPRKNYRLSMNSGYKYSIWTCESQWKFSTIATLVKGYVVKSLVWKRVSRLTCNCVHELTKLPALCSDKINEYLDCEDLLALYEALNLR